MRDLVIVLVGFAVVAALPLWALTRRLAQPNATWPGGVAYPRYWHRRGHTGRHRHIDDAELPGEDRRNLEVFREAKRHACRVAHLGWPAVAPGEWLQRRQIRDVCGEGRPYQLDGQVPARPDKEQQR